MTPKENKGTSTDKGKGTTKTKTTDQDKEDTCKDKDNGRGERQRRKAKTMAKPCHWQSLRMLLLRVVRPSVLILLLRDKTGAMHNSKTRH